MFPPGLSMLWESVDAGGALRERFGLDSFGDAVSWLSKELAQTWAVEVEACDRLVISDSNAIAWVHTDRGPFVAKWSRAQGRFDRLAAVAELLRALYEQGAPVAPPLASVDGRRRVVVDRGSSPLSMTVQPLMDGDLLDITDETAVHRAGACLASLHGALAGHRDGRLTEIESRPSSDLRERMETWLERRDVGRAPAASARLRSQIAALPPIDRDQQLIHNDYRAANILTAGSEVLAVIDFDEVVRDYCISDLANTFVVLGTHFTDWRPTPVGVRETFLRGYESVRPLTGLEHEWLRVLVLWRGIVAIPVGDDQAGWAHAL